MSTVEKEILVSRTINITPHPSMLAKLGSMHYKEVADSLAEFVDNAIDAEATNIEVLVPTMHTQGTIIIRDNGTGMTLPMLENALRVGTSGKRQIEQGGFGFGLKSAAASLGSQLQITTAHRHMTARSAHQVVIDFDAILRGSNWDVICREVDKPLHWGTEIRITGLKQTMYSEASIEKIRTRLGRIFKYFLVPHNGKSALRLLLNGDPVPPYAAETDSHFALRRFAVSKNGMEVTGWAGILASTPKGRNYGFDMLRNRRVIRCNAMPFRKEHTSVNLVCGDIYFPAGTPVTLDKTDFVHTPFYAEVLSSIAPQIQEVFAYSAHRQRQNPGYSPERLLKRLERKRLSPWRKIDALAARKRLESLPGNLQETLVRTLTNLDVRVESASGVEDGLAIRAQERAGKLQLAVQLDPEFQGSKKAEVVEELATERLVDEVTAWALEQSGVDMNLYRETRREISRLMRTSAR